MNQRKEISRELISPYFTCIPLSILCVGIDKVFSCAVCENDCFSSVARLCFFVASDATNLRWGMRLVDVDCCPPLPILCATIHWSVKLIHKISRTVKKILHKQCELFMQEKNSQQEHEKDFIQTGRLLVCQWATYMECTSSEMYESIVLSDRQHRTCDVDLCIERVRVVCKKCGVSAYCGHPHRKLYTKTHACGPITHIWQHENIINV